MNSDREAKRTACPPRELMARVARGEALADEEGAVEEHLNGCAACREAFEGLLGTAAEREELRTVAREASEADLEAIQATGVPRLPQAQADAAGVVLPGGLRLASPTRPGCLARLAGYHVISVVGEGGMGMVLKGWDESLRRHVALKVISPRWLHDPAVRQRFLDEARAAARLGHPNILTIHAVDQAGDLPLIVMEYVQGKPLSLLVAEQGRLEAGRAVRIARQILAALEHAHGEGIVHRDVKPANVLLEGEEERVKLVDFGLARGVAEAVRLTAEGSVLGTPWYMSPEQASGHLGPDPRSDLFSVGVVLFEMVVGTLPFPGQDVRHVLEQIRRGDAPDPRRLNPAVPCRLAEIIQRALQKERAGRYQSAAEFAQALDDYLAEGARMTEPWISSGPVATSQAGPLLRCSVCTAIVVSKLGVAGVCPTCQAPICAKCWSIRGVRQCLRHPAEPVPCARPVAEPKQVPVADRGLPAGRTDPAAADDGTHEGLECGRAACPAGQTAPAAQAAVGLGTIGSGSKTAAEASGLEAAGLPVAGIDPARERARQHAFEEHVQKKVAEARAAGRLAVSVAEVRLAEESFLRLVENSLASISQVADPCRGTTVTVKNWLKLARRTHRTFPLHPESIPAEQQEPWLGSAECGVGRSFSIRRRAWWGRLRARVVLEVLNLSRQQQLAGQGYDDQPVTRSELESLLNETSRRAAWGETWHVLILHSPTGWTEEARDFVLGKGPRPFHDRLVSVVLYEQASARFVKNETDEKLLGLKEAFAVDMDEAVLARAKQFIVDYFDCNSSLCLETLLGELGISRQAGMRVFKLLSATEAYDLETLDEVGPVLTQKR